MIDLLLSTKFWQLVALPVMAVVQTVVCWALIVWLYPEEPHAVVYAAAAGAVSLAIWEVRMWAGLRAARRSGKD